MRPPSVQRKIRTLNRDTLTGRTGDHTPRDSVLTLLLRADICVRLGKLCHTVFYAPRMEAHFQIAPKLRMTTKRFEKCPGRAATPFESGNLVDPD